MNEKNYAEEIKQLEEKLSKLKKLKELKTEVQKLEDELNLKVTYIPWQPYIPTYPSPYTPTYPNPWDSYTWVGDTTHGTNVRITAIT